MMINRFALNTLHRRWVAAILFATSMNGIAEDIQPGLWRITLESRVAATPDWNPEPFQLNQCLTIADAQNPEQLLIGLSTSGASGCEFLNRQTSGQRLQFEVQCSGTLGIHGQGTVDFTATTVTGILNARFAATDNTTEAVEMQNQLRAVYIGPCPAGSGTP